jgi:hypothetical protein
VWADGYNLGVSISPIGPISGTSALDAAADTEPVNANAAAFSATFILAGESGALIQSVAAATLAPPPRRTDRIDDEREEPEVAPVIEVAELAHVPLVDEFA